MEFITRSCRAGLLVIALVACCIIPLGCETTEPGVRTTMLEQYTTLDVGTAPATQAAADVLNDLGLHEVEHSSTNVDGWAKGFMADKSLIKVMISRATDTSSDISVKVGATGDTALGQDIIARVRAKLGLQPPATAPEATK